MSQAAGKPTEIVVSADHAVAKPGDLGRVVIAPEVLVTIVRQTVAQQSGVARLVGRTSSRRSGKGQRASREGLRIEVHDDQTVVVDLRVVVEAGVNMLDSAQTLQHEISRALEHMAGMTVRAVNVHIDDVDLSSVGADPDALNSQSANAGRRRK